MHIGVQLAQLGGQASPEAVTASARSAEALGFDSVWVIDPLLSPIPMQPPHPHVDESSLFAEQRAALDPLATLAFAAAATDRIRLGTNVIAASRYSPTVLARALATVDVLSGGRLTVGLDLGWAVDDHDVTGRPRLDRIAKQEEVLDVIDAAWTSAISPKPVQHPRPPLLLSAYSPKGLDRVARRADGWAPSGLPVESVGATFRQLPRRGGVVWPRSRRASARRAGAAGSTSAACRGDPSGVLGFDRPDRRGPGRNRGDRSPRSACSR